MFLSPLAFAQTKRDGCGTSHYKIIELPLVPVAINGSEQVAGTTKDHRIAVWSLQDGLHQIPLPPGYSKGEAASIDAAGRVVGTAYDDLFRKHQGFSFYKRVLTSLAGEQSRAFQITDGKRIAGESLRAGQSIMEPVIWTKNILHPLTNCCGGSAMGLNKNGDVVGNAYDEQGRYHAVLWIKNGGAEPIGPPNQYSSAVAINDLRHVLVQSISQVFLYADGILTQLSLSPKYPSQGRSLNNCDVIVGSFGPFSDAYRAFIWDKSSGFNDLNTRLAPDSGWKLEYAASINDRGEIVGRGDNRGQDDVGFLLIPID